MKKKPIKKIAAKKIAVKKVSRKTKSSRLLVLAIVNILAFLAVLVINYLAVQLPIGGMTTGALSDLYPNLFTPAGMTFSIWGLIYLAVLGFVVRQLIDLLRKKSVGITRNVGIRFLLSCAANIGRIFARHYQQVFLSVLIMIVFLVILIVLGNKVSLGKKLGSRWDKLLVQVPFSLYLGRISVAIIANISAWLVHIGWNMRGMSDVFWTIIVIVVAALLALRQLYKSYNIIFALVVIWAFIGIIFKRLAIDPVYAINILWTLGICIIIIATGIGARFQKWINN